MKKKVAIHVVDLFCGAGGTSSGLKKACEELGLELDLLAINHWETAIKTHSANHPAARHMCESLDNVDPRKIVPGGHLDLLLASPECRHHSRARGGKPCNDQSRSSAWHILRWAEAIRIENIIIENVKEFQTWGPLGANGLPLKSKKGETFNAFINALKSLGYKVDFNVITAANYGDPTSRERLFIIARKGNCKIEWPVPTHTKDGGDTLFGKTKKWKSAKDIIDWSIEGKSIFTRKKPLSPNTLRRIEAGLRKFCGRAIEPFLVIMKGTGTAKSVDSPMPAITTVPYIGVCEPEPFVLDQQSCAAPRSVKDPLPTVATAGAISLIQPSFLVEYYGNGRPHSVEKPLPTVTTKERFGVIQPSFLVGIGQTGSNGNRVRSIDSPLPTIVTKAEFAVVQSFLIGSGGPKGSANPRSLDRPLNTITTESHTGLIQPEIKGYRLDIKFRMLKAHELKRAMSFEEGYTFSGNTEAQVKQIGNAVPVLTAMALCKSVLKEYAARVRKKIKVVPIYNHYSSMPAHKVNTNAA